MENKKTWAAPDLRRLKTIAELREKLSELPEGAAVVRFELVWYDKNGYPNKTEYK